MNTGYKSKKELVEKSEVYTVRLYLNGKLIDEKGHVKDKTRAQIKKDMKILEADLKQKGIGGFSYEIVKHHVSDMMYDDGDTRIFVK